MADYSQQISTALIDILGSLNDIIPKKFTDINTLNNVNKSHQELIGQIQKKLEGLMNTNTSNENNNSSNTQLPTSRNNQEDVNEYFSERVPPTVENKVASPEGYKQNFSDNPNPLFNPEFDGGRRKRNRSSKNKRKSSEEQPEIKMEQEEAPESPKPQKKSFFSRFNPFKTKGGKRSRKHRTTKKGGRRHK
jgi:hypothetical protein